MEHVLFDRSSTDVTDVCMDESAVSSDPVTAFLLDEVVVKDWCKRTFNNILAELRGICILKDFLTHLEFQSSSTFVFGCNFSLTFL